MNSIVVLRYVNVDRKKPFTYCFSYESSTDMDLVDADGLEGTREVVVRNDALLTGGHLEKLFERGGVEVEAFKNN